MPKYVVERQYLLPVYQRLVVEADTVEAACEKAIDHGNGKMRWRTATALERPASTR
jgi:hypothetical protein